ncbi:protein kinase domain-containing protein [Nocardia xishanensis]
MIESDPFETQRDLGADVITELRNVGLVDAEEIGRGGFGVVYRCSQSALERTVAVKVLTCELDESRQRFFREQRAMGRLTGHPNIVGVLDVGESESGRPYLVMPYYSRGSLDARIRTDGPLPLEEVLRLGVKLAGALETAHCADVLHRDVKPANILLTDYGEPALTDFGIAHLASGFRTATGTITGSPAFTAPEVLSGDPSTRASDVYGLGATLFCALTGHAVFERRSGEQVVAQFLRITSQPVPDLRGHGIPEDVCAVIEAAMNRDPRNRPTAAVFGEQLQRLQSVHFFAVDQMALRAEPDGTGSIPATSAAPHVAHPGGGRSRFGMRAGMETLPLELTSFIDRRSQVAEAKNLLSASSLVTLTGMGGVGKSRLALRVAHRLRRDFNDGVWLVELGELREPSLLVDVVGAACGVMHQAGSSMLRSLVEFFSARTVLLVLDNCEHLIEAVAELVESLLQACPQLRVLATSREAIGIGGESVLAVPPLRFPDPETAASLRGAGSYDAVTLFVERAAAAVPDFRLTEANRAAIVGICARLDGLPLAIELAAARLRAMSCEQILARLNDRFAVLTRGSRRAPTRQQTLEWCIGWSYDLCTPAEQRLWNRLSVFAGFELDAAAEVCGSDISEPEFLDTLSALVDKSILIREETGGTVRFRLLETVQEFGIRKSEQAGEYTNVCRRHRDWFERMAHQAEADWVSPRQLGWIARITRDLPNLRKALDLSCSEANAAGLRTATALHCFWNLSGRFSEGLQWCDRMLTSVAEASDLDRARALYTVSVFADYLGDRPSANLRFAELRELAERSGDEAIESLLAPADGCIALSKGDLDYGSAKFQEAFESFSARGDLLLQMRIGVYLCWTYVLRGNMTDAVSNLEKLLTIADRHGDTIYRAQALRPLALALWQLGQRDRAIHRLEESLRLARQMVDPVGAAGALQILAWIAADKRDGWRAAVLLGAAHELVRSVGGPEVGFPQLLPYHQRCENAARDIVGKRRFEHAYQQGVGMSFEAAAGFALGESSQTAALDQSIKLTKREREVADLIAKGLTNKAIAARLVISQRTAQGHVEHILAKLGFTSRAQIAAWAAEQAG